jgi:hypothetical protein
MRAKHTLNILLAVIMAWLPVSMPFASSCHEVDAVKTHHVHSNQPKVMVDQMSATASDTSQHLVHFSCNKSLTDQSTNKSPDKSSHDKSPGGKSHNHHCATCCVLISNADTATAIGTLDSDFVYTRTYQLFSLPTAKKPPRQLLV